MSTYSTGSFAELLPLLFHYQIPWVRECHWPSKFPQGFVNTFIFPLYRGTGESLYVKWQGHVTVSRVLSLTHTPGPRARLWSQGSHDLALTPKPSPESFYPGWAIKLLCAFCVRDGERQGPWGGVLDPMLEVSWMHPSHSLCFRGGATVKMNSVSKSGVLNMTKDIAPLSNKKGNHFTFKIFLLSLLIRSLPCTQIHVGKGHFLNCFSWNKQATWRCRQRQL